MRKAKIILLIVVALVLCVAAYIMFGSYSDGYRAGTIIKLSRKGVAMKTYEGQLNLGMAISGEPGSVQVSNIWEFSVPASKDDVVKKLDDAMLNGKRVKLHYEEKFIKLPWRGDTKYMVDQVEEQ